MSQPFIGALMLVPYNFAPRGFMDCDGRSLPISQNDALFTLLGTTFGGDGQTTFNLPDLRSRLPIGAGQGPNLSSYVLGQPGGTETVTLTTATMGTHSHPFFGDAEAGDSSKLNGNMLAQGQTIYKTIAPNVALASGTNIAGGNQPHDNIQPFTTLRWVIAVEGLFPQQN
jgi:microcystin-dependent protein